MKKILITGNGKLANCLIKANNENKLGYKLKVLSRSEMDITNEKKVDNIIEEYSINGCKYLIHTAAITKPMSLVDVAPDCGVATNIRGTCNVAEACYKWGIKFIYISTDFVIDRRNEIYPRNKYSWSKLGGECVARVIPNSLILRCALTDIPFRHEFAYCDINKKSISHLDASIKILENIDEVGILNIEGKDQSIYDFVKQYQPNIKKGYYYESTRSI